MKEFVDASLVLLGVTILKLFLHDLSQLEQLYRIAAFIIVAIIAIAWLTFLYQRFLGASPKQAAMRLAAFIGSKSFARWLHTGARARRHCRDGSRHHA